MITEAETRRNREFEAAHLAARTNEAYASHWQGFEKWCKGRDASPLPAAPELIETYLTERALTRKAATAISDFSAILNKHKTQGYPLDAPHLRQAVTGIRRKAATQPRRQSKPLTIEILDRMEASRHVNPKHHAVAEVLFGAALRVSELTALRVGDIRFNRRTGRATIFIRTSKTDQFGAGATVKVGRRTTAVLNAEAYGRPPEDPLFMSRKKQPVVTRMTINRWLKEALKAIGEDPNGYSSHAGRVGAAMFLKEQGFDLDSIARFGRWSNVQTLTTYLREFDDSDAIADAFG